MFYQYRVIKHPDEDGYPNCWLIQRKAWWRRRWKAVKAFYSSKSAAEGDIPNIKKSKSGAKCWPVRYFYGDQA